MNEMETKIFKSYSGIFSGMENQIAQKRASITLKKVRLRSCINKSKSDSNFESRLHK